MAEYDLLVTKLKDNNISDHNIDAYRTLFGHDRLHKALIVPPGELARTVSRKTAELSPSVVNGACFLTANARQVIKLTEEILQNSTNLMTIIGTFKLDRDDAGLENFTVEVFDQGGKTINRLAAARINANNVFSVSLNLKRLERQYAIQGGEIYFNLASSEKIIHSTRDNYFVKLVPGIQRIQIELPDSVSNVIRPDQVKFPAIPITDLLTAAGVGRTIAAETARRLHGRGIRDLKTLTDKGGKLTERNSGLNEKNLSALLNVSKFTAVTKLPGLSRKLIKNRFNTFTGIAAVPFIRFKDRLGPLSKEEEAVLPNLYAKALYMRRNVTNYAVYVARSNSADANWPFVDIELPPVEISNLCKGCDDCNNIFSPLAYLYDLLDLVYYHWGVPAENLEKLFCQEIISLECKPPGTGFDTVPQVELAVEVLECYLGNSGSSLPITNRDFKKQARDAWLLLLGFPKEADGNLDDRGLRNHKPPAGTDPDSAGLEFIERIALLILDEKLQLSTIKQIRDELIENRGNQDLGEIAPFFRDITDQFDKLLDRTYASILALYRDALIKRLRRTAPELENLLFIDLQGGSCHTTNRITQAILSIQRFILSIRTGEITNVRRPDIPQTHRINFNILSDLPVEESKWKWLKDYREWTSAMYAFLYPENLMLPPLLDKGLGHKFRQLRDELINDPVLTTGKIKNAYLELLGNIFGYRLKDLASIKSTPLFYNDEGGDIAGIENGHIDAADIPEGDIEQAENFINNINKFLSLDDWMGTINRYLRILISDLVLTNFVDNRDARIYVNNELKVREAQQYLEARLFFPHMAAWLLNRSGEFAAAHDWYRQLYDPEASDGNKQVFDFNREFSGTLDRTADWIEGQLDPQVIAMQRKDVYLRHVIISMVSNILDWADHEYARATAESIDRARDLYEQAKYILQSRPLTKDCGRAIRELELDIVTSIGVRSAFDTDGLLQDINRLEEVIHSDILDRVIGEIRDVLDSTPDPGNVDLIRNKIDRAIKDSHRRTNPVTLGDSLARRRQQFANLENEYLFPQQGSGIRDESPDMAPAFATTGNYYSFGTGLPSEHLLLDTAGGSFGRNYHGVEEDIFYSSITMCVPPNPLLLALDFYIKVSQLKLRNCLDLAGESLPSDALSNESANEFLEQIARQVERQPATGDLISGANNQPRYRYSYLVEKARQYTDVAQRLGSALLQAFEKREEEAYRILQAEQALEVAGASINLKVLGQREARHGLDVTVLQKERANAQLGFWQDRINAGFMNAAEWTGVGLMTGSAALQATAAVIQGIHAIVAFAGAGAAGTVGGGAVGGSVGGTAGGAPAVPGAAGGGSGGALAGFSLGSALAAAMPGTAGALQSLAGALGTLGSVSLTVAGFQRRWEDWHFQRDLADFDYQIADAQISLARDRIDISDQEFEIATLQQAHARETLQFLRNKFNNEQLYQWMINVLLRLYRSVMQIASSTARMAQQALEFERQERIEIIQGDYWSINSAAMESANLSEEQREVGLLGPERLLTDLTKLDAFKVQTEKRRLQLTRTISMALTMPGELALLRQTGQVTFNTLLSWFDLDSPGDYLRLIKAVKVSVMALIPPVDGMHAVLKNGGESTVVIRGDEPGQFVRKRAMRNFGERVVLDAPFSETGLFVFDYNDPMFLPFEGLGVETQWTLEMPKASNKFDFDTIVDVLFTIDYTADHSDNYAKQVRNEIGETMSEDLILDLHNQFPDQWYHLMNDIDPAGGTAGDKRIMVNLPDSFLPNNLINNPPADSITVIHMTLLVIGDFILADEADLKGGFSVKKGAHTYGKGGTDFTIKELNGSKNLLVQSTRAQGESALKINNPFDPVGDWEIGFDNLELGDGTHLKEHITNMILMISIEGTIHWPAE